MFSNAHRSLAGMLLAFQITSNSKGKPSGSRSRAMLSLTALVILLTLTAACGGGGSGGGGHRGQTFTISIRGVSQNFQHLTSAVLVVD